MSVFALELQDRHFIVGVTGGIAAYKTAELVRLLIKNGATVDVVMTEAATHFVGAATFQALTGRPVWQDLWDTRIPNGMAHIDLSRQADAILIAPASADTLARLAHGHANDLLSTLCLARTCPLIVAPAMNKQMWENPATQRNLAQLVADGVHLFAPNVGLQACGEEGAGRMQEPAELYEALLAFVQPKILQNQKILMTAGPTFELLDPVRGLTNRSSGKMGFALARAAAQAGAQVTLIAGPVSLSTPYQVKRIDVQSALEMHQAALAHISGQDIFIGVAAVADFRPAESEIHKIKKNSANLSIRLTPNPDILAAIAALPNPPYCVGFAAETQNLAAYAQGKRQQKRLGMVVGNLVQEALNLDHSKASIFDAEGEHPLKAGTKAKVAWQIIQHLAQQVKSKAI